MDQKNTKAVSFLQKKKQANKWLLLLKPLTYLGILLVGFSVTACEKDRWIPNCGCIPQFPTKWYWIGMPLHWRRWRHPTTSMSFQHQALCNDAHRTVWCTQFIKPVYKNYCNTAGDAAAHRLRQPRLQHIRFCFINCRQKRQCLTASLQKQLILSGSERQTKRHCTRTAMRQCIIDLRKGRWRLPGSYRSRCTINSSRACTRQFRHSTLYLAFSGQ